MINDKTYYQVLGVLNTAEDLVIRAAYRSLSNKYHPDKWTGDKKVAHERMSEINAAYQTLGDAAKRQKYDEELKRQGKYDDAADIDNDTSDFEGIYSEHSDAWDIALQFFPDLNALHERLRKINSSLAYTFKTILIEKKNFPQASELVEQMEREFLIKYFGKDESILGLAKFLITHNARVVAKELNRIMSVMGNSVTAAQITEVLKKKYPRRVVDQELHRLLYSAKRKSLSEYDQIILLTLSGATKIELKELFWSWRNIYSFTWIDGTKQLVNGWEELSSFIETYVLPLYEE